MRRIVSRWDSHNIGQLSQDYRLARLNNHSLSCCPARLRSEFLHLFSESLLLFAIRKTHEQPANEPVIIEQVDLQQIGQCRHQNLSSSFECFGIVERRDENFSEIRQEPEVVFESLLFRNVDQ